MILPILAELGGSIHVGLAAMGVGIGIGLTGLGSCFCRRSLASALLHTFCNALLTNLSLQCLTSAGARLKRARSMRIKSRRSWPKQRSVTRKLSRRGI